jgi:hypothetical protein
MANELVVTEDKITDLAAMTVQEGAEEQFSQDELELPFLRVAQKGSPQVDDGKPEHIEDLKPGQFFNTVTGEIYGDEIKVQVHGYFHNFVIWKGPKGAGKYSGAMTPAEFETFQETNKLDRDGGDMVQFVDGEEFRYTDTRNFIVSLPDHEEDGILLYPMYSTGIKPAKKWNSLYLTRKIGGKQTVRYATVWSLKTAHFEDKGYSWKQVGSVKPLGYANEDLMEFGRAYESFVKDIRTQGVKYTNGDAAVEADEDSEF